MRLRTHPAEKLLRVLVAEDLGDGVVEYRRELLAGEQIRLGGRDVAGGGARGSV